MSDDSFALDIGEKYTRIVDAKQTKGGIEIVSMGQLETVANLYSINTETIMEKQAEVILKLYSGLKIKNKKVKVVIPDVCTYSQIVEMPKLNEKELLSAIRYQADQFIPMPIEDVMLDIEILREDPKSKKLIILIVASPKNIVEKVQRMLETMSFLPESLENDLSAFGRLFFDILHYKSSESAYLVFNLGFTGSSVYLVDGSTSNIISIRTIKLGLDLFMKDIKFNFNTDDTKAFEILKKIGFEKNSSYDVAGIIQPITKEYVEEFKKIIMLAKDQYNIAVQKIFVFNHNSNILSLEKNIESLIGLPTVSLNLAGYIQKTPVVDSHSNEIPSFISAIAANFRT